MSEDAVEWFRETPWCFVPTHSMGWCLVLLTASACLRVLVVFESRAFTVGELVVGATPWLLFFVGALVIVARATCAPSED